MPLHEAVWFAGTDKIYGVSENYIVKFNASSGAKEATAKVCAPCLGNMRIAASETKLYVSSAHDHSYFHYEHQVGRPNKAIWEVDPVTLEATKWFDYDAWYAYWNGQRPYEYHWYGLHQMMIPGDGWLYACYTWSGSHTVIRILMSDPNNPLTTQELGNGNGNFHPELFAMAPTPDDRIMRCDPNQHEIERWTWDESDDGASRDPHPDFNQREDPVAVCWAENVERAYAVCGTGKLWRADTWDSPYTITLFNLELIQANVKPARIRWSPLDGGLYIPDQSQDVILHWNTNLDTTESASMLVGFESPIDVVFTDEQGFAVQSAPIGLTPLFP